MTYLSFQSVMLFSVKHLHRFLKPFTMDEMIRYAITEKKLLSFDYKDHHRFVEPHVYGRKYDLTGILTFQIGGESSSGGKLPDWRRMHLKGITNMRVLDKTFLGKREIPNKHSAWDFVYLIVDR